MMSNPDEANKINRLRKELSRSRHLTEVEDDFHLFEAATNKHFNKEMNREALVDSKKGTQSSMDFNVVGQRAAFDNIKSNILNSVERMGQGSSVMHTDTMPSKRDFARKNNSFAPVLINDGYANFRFSNRASDILSPLSKTKYGFNTTGMSKQFRKMSQTYQSTTDRNVNKRNFTVGSSGANSFNRTGQQ